MRVLIHAPSGALAAWILWEAPLLGIFFALGLFAYQLTEDWRIKDGSYQDIKGYLWGGAIASSVLILW